MSDELEVKVKATIEADEAASAQRIKNQLPTIENSLKSRPIKIPVEADTSEITQSVDQTVKAATSSLKGKKAVIPISAAFNIDLKDSNAVRAEVQKLVSQLTGNKGELVDFKINTTGLDKAKKVLLTYKNEAQETVNTVLKLKKTSEVLMPDGTKQAKLGWVIDSSSYQKSFAQMEKAQEKLADLKRDAESFKETIQRNTTISGNFDFSKLDAALDSGNIKVATNALKDLTHQYDLFKINSKKDLAADAIENLPKQIGDANTQLKVLGDTLASLQAKGAQVPQEMLDKVAALSAEMQTLSSGTMGTGEVARFNALSLEIEKVANAAKEMASGLKLDAAVTAADTLRTKYERLLQVLDNLKKDWSAFTHDPKLMTQYDSLVGQVQSAMGNGKMSSAGWTNLNSQVGLFRAQVQGAGKDTKTLWGQVGDTIKKFGSWFFIGGTVATTVRAVNDLFNNVVELNKAYADLKIVTNGTDAQTKELLDSYTALGERIGATTTEVASAASDWLRQGKNIADTATLIQDSMVLSKVANIDSATSTQLLTSAMKGYNVTVNDTLGIVDKLTSVDLISATSAAGLAEGMSEVANNANLAGVSMDKLLGYLATVGEVTQESMNSVGTSFNAIFARMGAIKLSRLKDYQDETGEDLNNTETVLRGLGVQLRDSSGQFKNFGGVLDEIAGKWTSYDNVTQRAIASAIAGVRHYEDFVVLMNNYNKATEYSTASTKANGTAMQKMATYTESIEAKQKKLTAATEGLSSALINSELIKFSYDSSTGVLGFLTEVIKSVGALPTLIAAASAALSFKNVGWPKMSGYRVSLPPSSDRRNRVVIKIAGTHAF